MAHNKKQTTLFTSWLKHKDHFVYKINTSYVIKVNKKILSINNKLM